MEEKKNGKAIGLREHQQIMLDMLSGFAAFCGEHKLQYFLDAGTLLGAVRHRGFIPWDNDMDLCMLRPDYDRFCEIVRERGGKLSEKLRVEFPEDTIYPFLKIVDSRTVLIEFSEKYPLETGVYIDLFCKDGIRDDSLGTKLLCKTSEMLGLLYWVNRFSVFSWERNGNAVLRLIAAVGRKTVRRPTRPIELQQRLLRWNAQKHPLESCRYVTTLSNGEFHKRAPKECFAGAVLLPFEGRDYPCPVGYDAYLKCLYPGDYRKLPPPEKRGGHDVLVMWREGREEPGAVRGGLPFREAVEIIPVGEDDGQEQ